MTNLPTQYPQPTRRRRCNCCGSLGYANLTACGLCGTVYELPVGVKMESKLPDAPRYPYANFDLGN